MRIVSREELMQQPIGTVFRKFEPCVWRGEWLVLEAVWPSDFVFRNLGPQPLDGPDDLHGLKWDDSTERDGCFDHDATYVILDQKDIEDMARQWAACGGLHVS